MTVLGHVKDVRTRLSSAFAPDTAYRGEVGAVPSVGHCAVAALIVREVLGGDLLRAAVGGEEHWFNRLPYDGAMVDVDVTGDQYGRPPVQVAAADELYAGARVEGDSAIERETVQRAVLLATRADIPFAVERLRLRFGL